MITDNFLKAISDIKLNELHSSFSTIHKDPLSFGAFNFGPYDLAITSLEFHKNDDFHEYQKERLSLRFSIQSGRTKYWGSLGLDLYYDDQIQFSLNEFFEKFSRTDVLCGGFRNFLPSATARATSGPWWSWTRWPANPWTCWSTAS